MFKCVEKKVLGCNRKIRRTVMICDRCGREINWCVYNAHGQFCEDCLKKIEKLKGGG